LRKKRNLLDSNNIGERLSVGEGEGKCSFLVKYGLVGCGHEQRWKMVTYRFPAAESVNDLRVKRDESTTYSSYVQYSASPALGVNGG
jgi:hypothetical protein